MLEGNWVSTLNFEEQSGVKIFVNIKGFIKKSCRVIFISAEDEETCIFDGHLYLINYNPLVPLFVTTHGLVRTSGLDEIFPKQMKFRFNPIKSEFKLYDKICYADLVKMC